MPLTLTARSFLADLVSIPSVSPEGEAGGTKPGEAVIADYVTALFKQLGADRIVRQEALPGRENVIATFEPAQKATATVALVPHLDTVGVAGMTVPPFALTARGGRLHGRGSCDTKGTFAALLGALAKWTKSSARQRGSVRWVIAATVAEETGGAGARFLADSGFRPDFMVALEPTDLKVVHANKGVLRVWLESKGRAAHGSMPEAGRNAVYPLLPLLGALETKLAKALAKHPHPLLGRATVNLGVLQGGKELNIVPDFCRAGLDLRTHPDCDNKQAYALIDELRRKHAPTTKLVPFREGPSYVTPRTDAWASRLRSCGKGWAVANWFCDANWFAAAGVPSVAFGPGSIAQAHTKDEYITTKALADGEAAFGKFLAQEP